MNRRQLFLELLVKAGPSKLVFTDHFLLRKAVRGVGEGTIEDLLFNRKQDLIYAQEDENKRGKPRFRAFYDFTKRKALLIIADIEKDGYIRIVTFVQYDKKAQLEAMRNANKYAKLAGRL